MTLHLWSWSYMAINGKIHTHTTAAKWTELEAHVRINA